MDHLYGTFTGCQISDQIRSLHSAIHWLLIYKDPQTGSDYKDIQFDKYFSNLMRRINGFGNLVGNPPHIVTLLSVLEAARLETVKLSFDFSVYRKLIFDAQSIVDKLGGCNNAS